MTTIKNRPKTALIVIDVQYWTYQTAPGRTAGTIKTEAVDFGGTS